MNSLGELFGKASYFLNDNSASILTGVGVAGVITTSVLTGKAVLKADMIITDAYNDRAYEAKKIDPDFDSNKLSDFTLQEKLKMTWTVFAPPIIMGTTTVLAIILANRLASKEIAALAAAYTISDKALAEYKEKVVEKIGKGKEEVIHNEIMQKRMTDHPVNTKEVIIAGTGEVLCYDVFSGRYFQSSIEEIKRAENKINFEIVNTNYASLSAFYDEIGLPPNGMSDVLGFNLESRLEIRFDTQMSSHDKPCVTIDFHIPPIPDYGRHVY